MKRIATFLWESPPPSSVDEVLAAFDDGSVWLVVRRPRAVVGSIGTYVLRPGPEDHAALAAAGPGPVVFNVLDPAADTSTNGVRSVVERIATKARETPRAVATFGASALGAASPGVRSMALTVVGSGTTTVEFELEPTDCTVQFSASGRPIAWFPLPELGSGFVTPMAVGLGGLRRPAEVAPGVFGATAFDIPAPGEATTVGLQVAGWLAEALPDEPTPAPFLTRTAETTIPA